MRIKESNRQVGKMKHILCKDFFYFQEYSLLKALVIQDDIKLLILGI